MRAAVVANCQARPIAELLQGLCAEIESVCTIIVHLGDKDAREHDYALLEGADVIFAQFVSDQYFVPHVATSRLKAAFGHRVISWPNIYFRGQCPDLGYAAVGRTRRLMGPLRDYHLRCIYDFWKAEIGVDACLNVLQRAEPQYERKLAAIAAASLDELETRETQLDTRIGDVIAAQWRRRRLFFTFNHPTSYLLEMMALRLLEAAKLREAGSRVAHSREPLGIVVPPVLRREADALGGALSASETCLGAEFAVVEGKIVLGQQRTYTIRDLVAGFYAAYDRQLEADDVVHFTPV